ncbi:MAG: DUF481 domain-containing protein [Woeseia sp.]
MKLRLLLVVTACLTAFAPLQAQEEVAAVDGPWAGKAALGYLATSGNSESSSLNTKFELGYTSGKWEYLADASAINAQESEQTTAEAYKLGFKSEYSFSEDNFLYGRMVWRKDLFSAYDQQFSQTVGYGRRLLDTMSHQLSADIGVGARQSELRDGTTENDLIARGGINYRWIITETASFSQDLTVESGDVNTYIESVSAITASLVGNLALVASYTIKNNSEVPVGTDSTDTYTALSIEYAF